MQNFVQLGNSVTITAPQGGVTSGDLVIVGSLVGVAAMDAAAGADVEIAASGVFTLSAAPADEIAVGDMLYYDSQNSVLTKVAGTSSRPVVGVAVSAKVALGTTVNVKLGAAGQTGPAA